MPNDPWRTLRLRWEDLQGPDLRSGRVRSTEVATDQYAGAPRFIGRVRDAGAIPSANDRVFLVNPARIDGDEIEGVGAAVSVDESRSIPVLVVGTLVPRRGDLLIAHASGGRWVAVVGGKSRVVSCGACQVPRQNLTLTWTNGLLGTRSTPMVFNGVDEWTTGCINQLSFRLSCRSNAPVFTATYYFSGLCPTGQAVACTGPGVSPTGLTLAAQSCEPLFLQYTVTSCPTLSTQGYTKFTVTQ